MPVRVERHIIIKSKEIDKICFLSKNLYNLANYYIRQEFINNRKWIRYKELNSLLKGTSDYKLLPIQTSQQVLRLLDKNWISFFKSIKDYSKHPDKYKGRPKLPKYKHKTKGRNIVTFTDQQCKLKDGYIHFPKRSEILPLKTKVNNLKGVRIIPQATCFVIEVIYENPVEIHELKENTYLSIDLGINNLVTCVNNIGLQPFIINGRIVKSMNQYYNKFKAVYQSYIGDKGNSNRINRLTLKRNNKIQDYLHKTSRFIVNYCLKYGISTIIIGKNKEWKQEINIGKTNNQNFVSIPFDTLIRQITYKAEEVGIAIITNEESYTSKCSFLDLESVEKQVTYLGKRIKRGLFKSSKGILINADVNGAYNILRKAVSNVFNKIDEIEGVGLHPVKFSL